MFHPLAVLAARRPRARAQPPRGHACPPPLLKTARRRRKEHCVDSRPSKGRTARAMMAGRDVPGNNEIRAVSMAAGVSSRRSPASATPCRRWRQASVPGIHGCSIQTSVPCCRASLGTSRRYPFRREALLAGGLWSRRGLRHVWKVDAS